MLRAARAIRACSSYLWSYFKDYHYLSHSLHTAPDCYVALIKDRPVGFISAGHGIGKIRFFRVGRVVTIPDYQGIGIEGPPHLHWRTLRRAGKAALTMVMSNP